MSSVIYEEKALLRRSKSMCSLSDDALTRKTVSHEKSFCDYAEKRSRTASECSARDSDSETSLEEHELGAAADLNVGLLVHLEQKMDRLSDLFLEQSRLLTTLKGAIQNSKDAIEKSGNVQSQLFAELDKNIITLQPQTELGGETSDGEPGNSRGRSLLEAIEAKHARTDVSDALTLLLQTDELKERVVVATAAAVREELRACVARDVPAACRPGLRRAQRRLAAHAVRALEDAFIELEEHGAAAARRVQRATRQLRRALERHRAALGGAPPRTARASLRRAAEEILDSEMQQWRQKILQAISLGSLEPEGEGASPAASADYQLGPASPAQPHDPDHSIIDQLMQAAEINKQIEDGDVNGSFERALSASDLSLVVAACRAAEPGGIGAAGPGAVGAAGPARLRQPVLLALAQQLATDMLHDTQLKCRYLEEAIISLNPSNPATRAHLPTVVGEVRKHLMKFLLSYPNHVAGRRITLIVMAADNLLKYCC